MAVWNLLHFSHPKILRQLSPKTLVRFLRPHQRFFQSHGLKVSKPEEFNNPFYSKLATLFLSPPSGMPAELIAALYMIDGMAESEDMDELSEIVSFADLKLNPETVTPSDYILHLWLKNPEVVKRRYTEQAPDRLRRFESYRVHSGILKKPNPLTPERIATMEAACDGWFQKKARGHGTRIILIQLERSQVFLIRHGDTLRREDCLTNGKDETICFRPAKYDVIFLLREGCELRVNARSRGERLLYASVFAESLYGQPEAFTNEPLFTLETLATLQTHRQDLESIPAILSIRLTELHSRRQGHPSKTVIQKSSDLLAETTDVDRLFIPGHKMVKAIFRFQFRNITAKQTVVIAPPNAIHYSTEVISEPVDQWLSLNGLMVPVRGSSHASARSAVVSP